jgi:hypothetical protein
MMIILEFAMCAYLLVSDEDSNIDAYYLFTNVGRKNQGQLIFFLYWPSKASLYPS